MDCPLPELRGISTFSTHHSILSRNRVSGKHGAIQSLSNDVVHSVSQILEQKASGLIKLDKQQYDSSGNPIIQKAYDSKVILIMGHWKQLEESSNELESEIKKKTFELFRNDSRNIETLTYDELYDRARFIVGGEKNEIESEDTTDDIPF